jgi:hypothetical protein
MAEIYMGVNELGATGAGHAFVGVQYDDGRQVEIHGQPEGGILRGTFGAILGPKYRSVHATNTTTTAQRA